MVWGERIPKLEAMRAQGKRTPLDNQPYPSPGHKLEWQAFVECHERREVGFQPSPISIASIESWLEFRRIHDVGLRERIFDMVCLLDRYWFKNKKEK